MFDLMLAGVVALSVASPAPAVQVLPSISVSAPCAQLTLQVASTQAERERGLMSVTKLRPHTGMLFSFDTDEAVTFWMKDTLVSLDMIFIGPDGTVRNVAARVPVVPRDLPDDKIPRRSGTAKYVIELAAGEAEKDGIVAGVTLSGVTNSPH